MKAFCEPRNGLGKGHPSDIVQGAADKVAFKGRILLGLDDIAGYLSSLRKGFDRLGVPVDTVFTRPHPFDYEADPVPEVWRVMPHGPNEVQLLMSAD